MAGTRRAPFDWGSLRADRPLTPEEVDQRATELLSHMTLKEKIAQMTGDTPLLRGALQMLVAYNYRPIPAGENRRLGIPPLCFTDGPRGVVMYHSTCFPVSMARGATWDPELEEQVGDAIGVEARAQGANCYAGVCVNLLRHPAWGRAQETYGEDPFHVGTMGAALVRGVQRHIMACVKHLAANSIERARFRVDVRLSERALREVYLPHFRRCVDEGVAAVMSAYNRVNGAYCSENRHLLRDILKGEWGFSGLVMSDFLYAVHDAKAAIEAGLDLEMPFARHYGRRLLRLVERGEVSEAYIDDAVRRVLRQKIRFAQVGEPARYRLEAVAGPEHRALARLVAQKAIVLLKNEPVADWGAPLLPLDPGRVRRLAVIGRLACMPNTGDTGSSKVRPPEVVTVLDGLKAARVCEVLYDRGDRIRSAVALARRCDAAVVVVGLTHREEGEYMPFPRKGGDRIRLTLSDPDEALIQAVAATNPRTAVVLMGGGPILCEGWRERVAALLIAWYPGMEGGHALADVLFGRVCPGGRLPCVFPRSAEHLPFFDPEAETIEYGLFHGYRLLEKEGHRPAFPFGFGLSYTRFTCTELELEPERDLLSQDVLRLSVLLENRGSRSGEEVIQVYVGYPDSRVERPVKELKAFRKVALAPGETRRVELFLPVQEWAYYDEGEGRWRVEPGRYLLYVGRSSEDAEMLHAEVRVLPEDRSGSEKCRSPWHGPI